MQGMTTEDHVASVAAKTGFGADAIEAMRAAMARGGGRMAQFSHPEFGGSGQWMSGGMLMIADPSDHALKSRIEQLCAELSTWDGEPVHAEAGSFQRQSQGTGAGRSVQDSRDPAPATARSQAGMGGSVGSDSRSQWWPKELGSPDSSGSQNDTRYAYFSGPRRLAVSEGGQVRVHDTGDHRIGGFSQQQGSNSRHTFQSQHGEIDLNELPVVAAPDVPKAPKASAPAPASESASTDAFVALEKLSQLHARGILDDREFADKKAELLKRI